MAEGGADRTHVRLAELVAALSLGVDLGFGQPMEHVLRQCLIALRLAERAGIDEDGRAAVYYTALLIGVGCHTDAHEQAKWFGDDIALKSGKYDGEMRGLRAAASGVRLIGSGRPPLHRFRVGLEFAFGGFREVDNMIEHHAGIARSLAAMLELPDAVVQGVGSAYEQWDGKGWPGELSGEGVPLATRIAGMSEFIEVAHRVGGVPAAKDLARQRRGKQFDPQIADLIIDHGDLVLSGLDGIATWDEVVAAEPALAVVVSGDRLDSALTAIADFVDLKSPYFLGHARAVAALAASAGEGMGMPEGEIRALRRAGLLHGLGRLGVSNSIWDKAGPLGAGEWERVRFHPYLTARMLEQSEALAPYGAIALALRERLDGSGYPRGLSGGAIGRSSRVLAAADAYQAMVEPRPHREALGRERAAAELRAEVKAGRLDGAAAEAVLGAAGHRTRRRSEGPAGLTAREVEVLMLLIRGRSNRQIGEELVISPKTVGRHIENIYSKIGVSSRPAASLFAMQHGLLTEEVAAVPKMG